MAKGNIIIVLAATAQLSVADAVKPPLLECVIRQRRRGRGQMNLQTIGAFQLMGGSANINRIKIKKSNYISLINHLQLSKNNMNDEKETTTPSFLSTSKSTVSFTTTRRQQVNNNNKNGSGNSPSNLSIIDQLLLSLTSDRTSLLLGSLGIIILLLNRLLTFPDDNAIYETSRSRIDLLGVFASGSVLLNGITKLDITSVRAERVLLEGTNVDQVLWSTFDISNKVMMNDDGVQQQQQQQQQLDKRMADTLFQSTVEWALQSYLRCSPSKSAVLLATSSSSSDKCWIPVAKVGILPLESQPMVTNRTPILDRILRADDGNIMGGTVGGTVGGTELGGGGRGMKGPKESYLPTLQALPGKVEFTYLPSNAQEVLILPVVSKPERSRTGQSNNRHKKMDDNFDWKYAIVLGGDTAKSFAPRDIAWCKEIASWIGELI